MKLLMPSFPRQAATPQRKNCLTKENFYGFVNKYNGLKNLYYSLYKTSKEGEIIPIIDKLFFDFDGPDLQKVLEHVLRFSEALEYEHTILFSGKKGFHVYVFCRNGEELSHPKDALLHAHKYIKEKYDINPDEKIFGDVNRIGRMPNTMHMSSGLYCIPVDRKLLRKGFEEVIAWAGSQHKEVKVYCGKLFDMKIFDYACSNGHNVVVQEHDYVLKNADKVVNSFLPCVRTWLEQPETYCKNETRYLFALYCNEMGIPPNTCISIAKKYWGKTRESGGRRSKFDEFIAEKQIIYAGKSDKPFPNCQALYAKGFCLGRCQKYKEKGSPLYV